MTAADTADDPQRATWGSGDCTGDRGLCVRCSAGGACPVRVLDDHGDWLPR